MTRREEVFEGRIASIQVDVVLSYGSGVILNSITSIAVICVCVCVCATRRRQTIDGVAVASVRAQPQPPPPWVVYYTQLRGISSSALPHKRTPPSLLNISSQDAYFVDDSSFRKKGFGSSKPARLMAFILCGATVEGVIWNWQLSLVCHLRIDNSEGKPKQHKTMREKTSNVETVEFLNYLCCSTSNSIPLVVSSPAILCPLAVIHPVKGLGKELINRKFRKYVLRIISINPLKLPFMTEVSILGGPVSGLVGKSSLYTPFTLNQSASLIGVLGFANEIPLMVSGETYLTGVDCDCFIVNTIRDKRIIVSVRPFAVNKNTIRHAKAFPVIKSFPQGLQQNKLEIRNKHLSKDFRERNQNNTNGSSAEQKPSNKEMQSSRGSIDREPVETIVDVLTLAESSELKTN
nr:hypothetical protein CR513_32820 [Ipomoea batatas]